MKQWTNKSFCSMLKRNGYRQVRQNGNHQIWENQKGKPIIISKEFVVEPGAKLKPVETPDEILVPYKLAVCQFAIEEVPFVNIHEVYDVSVFKSERGDSRKRNIFFYAESFDIPHGEDLYPPALVPIKLYRKADHGSFKNSA